MKFTYAVRNFMSSDLVTVAADQSIDVAMNVMVAKEIGSVVVVAEDDRLIGILTERDIIKYLSRTPRASTDAVKTAMSQPLITIDSAAAIGQAADVMAENGIRRLLVTEEEKIIGIITERDLMRATLDVFKKLSDAWV